MKDKRRLKGKCHGRCREPLVPVHSEGVEWQTAENGRVTLRVENKGAFNRLAQLLFFRPKVSYIHLDDLGSFVWSRLDGKTQTADIVSAVEKQYGNEAQPTEERLLRFLGTLKENGFIVWN